jgi:hypothetical protein
MFLEQLGECRYRDIECVRSIVLLNVRELGCALDAPRLLERLQFRFGVGVDVVGQYTKRAGVRFIEKPALLEEEGQIRLVADLENTYGKALE